ncbi:uncharacterized protein [Diadema antillarum]|uniref:uncharacterized protein n=1 Tax=Diadema antillarum TaxID=105358 RepID=UPI003A86CFEE
MEKQYPPPPPYATAAPNPYGGHSSYGPPPPPQQQYPQPPQYPQSHQYPQPAYGPPPVQPHYPAYPQPPTGNNNSISNSIVVGAPMAPVQAAVPQTTIIRHSSQDNCCAGENPSFNSEMGRFLGFIQLLCGIITIVIIGVSYSLRNYFEYPGIGSSIAAAIIFYIPTGILGMFTYSKNRCVIIGYLVMCILTSLESFGMICYESTAAALYSYDQDCIFFSCWYSLNTAVVALHAVAAFLALVVFITVQIGMCLCCKGSQVNGTGTTVVYTGNTQTVHTGTVVRTGGW